MGLSHPFSKMVVYHSYLSSSDSSQQVSEDLFKVGDIVFFPLAFEYFISNFTERRLSPNCVWKAKSVFHVCSKAFDAIYTMIIYK